MFDIVLVGLVAVLTGALVLTRMNFLSLEKSYREKLAARTKLVRAAAHELKQPLNAITGLVNSMRHGAAAGDSMSEDLASKLDRSAQELGEALTDTHEIFELSTGGLHMDVEPLEVRTETKMLLRKINRRLKEKGRRVTAIGGYLPEVWVETDKLRLLQCLRTLIEQAAEQSRDGEVRVSYQVEKLNGATHKLTFVVRDNGPGMDQHRARRFFDPSAYEQNPALRGRPAAMLALNLAAGLAEMMGGGITARSSLGNGTAFEFTIRAETCPPLEADVARAEANVLQPSKPPSFEKLSVLLVDDNEVNLFVLQEFVMPLGFGEVVCVSSGQEAVERAERDSFDLILMDLAMPVVDGFEASRAIRDGKKSSAAAILAVSAEFMKAGDPRLVAAGIDGFVPKPVVHADLFAAILKVSPQMVENARLRGVDVEERRPLAYSA